MTVIAMTMEVGVRGDEVADGVAKSLGISVVSNDLAERVAGKAKVKQSYVQRLREGKASLLERLRAPDEKITLYTAEEVLDLAKKGNVLLRGWGSTMLLRHVPHIPCIRVCAPLEMRIRTCMERLGTDDAAYVRDEIEASDEAHGAAMHSRFRVKWGDPLLFDLTLNTGRVSIDSCVAQVVALAGRPEFRETAESHAKLANLAVEARVRAAFLTAAETQEVDVVVIADGGKITLRGMVASESERKSAGTIAAKVKGVTKTVNELRVIPRTKWR